jgi:pimeloyl-ACP methyl ester carboxylesterase
MGTVIVGQENSTPIELYYEDHGSGPAVVLLSGWPLDSRSWEPQLLPLLEAGRVDTVRQAIRDDRPAWLTGLLADFLNLDELLGKRVSEDTVHNAWNAGAEASPVATWACVLTWLDDFHEDLKRIDIPTLVLHGTADRILSVEGQGRRMHAALPDARYVEIEGGPHVMCVSHAKEVNEELLAFLRQTSRVGVVA